MKTLMKVVFLCCLFATTLSMNAQYVGYSDPDEKSIFFGVKSGINISDYHGVSTDKSRVGFNLGITVDFKVATNWYVLTGLEYTVKGAKSKGYIEQDAPDGHKYNLRTKDNLNYLQLPLQAGYKFNLSDDVRLMVHAGGYMAYGVGGKATYDYEAIDGGTSWTDKIDFFGVGVGKFDYGVIGGVGVEYHKFVLDVNYELGLREYAKDHYNESKNKNLAITLGYKF